MGASFGPPKQPRDAIHCDGSGLRSLDGSGLGPALDVSSHSCESPIRAREVIE